MQGMMSVYTHAIEREDIAITDLIISLSAAPACRHECVHTLNSRILEVWILELEPPQIWSWQISDIALAMLAIPEHSLHTWHYAWAFKKPRTLPTTSSSFLQRSPAPTKWLCNAPSINLWKTVCSKVWVFLKIKHIVFLCFYLNNLCSHNTTA